MDDAKKMLDELMGQSRNVPLKEAKKNKGNAFKADTVCQWSLVGWCPIYEQLFRNTKRHLGECDKVHSDVMRAELEAHPDKASLKLKYCTTLNKYLADLVKGADEAVQRHIRDVEMKNQDILANGPSESAKMEIQKVKDNCAWALSESERFAGEGKIKESKEWLDWHEQQKVKVEDLEERCKQPLDLEICKVCGMRPESKNGWDQFSHADGKIHQGFFQVREWHVKTKDMMRELELEIGKEAKNKDAGDGDRKDGDAKNKDAGDGDRKDGDEARDAGRARGEQKGRERSRSAHGGQDRREQRGRERSRSGGYGRRQGDIRDSRDERRGSSRGRRDRGDRGDYRDDRRDDRRDGGRGDRGGGRR